MYYIFNHLTVIGIKNGQRNVRFSRQTLVIEQVDLNRSIIQRLVDNHANNLLKLSRRLGIKVSSGTRIGIPKSFAIRTQTNHKRP